MGIYLITGAERGIGLEVCRQLLQRGDTVVMGWFDEPTAALARKELSPLGEFHDVRLDVTDDASISAAFEFLQSQLPRLDGLLNNAGVVEEATPDMIDRDHLQRIFEVNTFGPALVTKAALPLLAASPDAQIVNVASGGGSLTKASSLGPGAKSTIMAYAASKAALNMMTIQTDIMLREVPEWQHIRINSVSPGATATHIGGFKGQAPEQTAAFIVGILTSESWQGTRSFRSSTGTYPW